MSSNALALRCATFFQAGVPDGHKALWVIASPNDSAITCDVPAVPRKWHPPPGEAQALQPTS